MIREYSTLSITFIILVAFLYSALIMGALWGNNRVDRNARWSVRILRIAVGGFLLLTGFLALDGFFLDFASMPPKVFLAIAPAFIGMLVLGFNPLVRKWLASISQTWLIGIQSFRIIVEIQLYFLAMTPLLPKVMTFEGRNFDILVGLTAIPVAYYCHRVRSQNKKIPRGLLVGWNVAGILILTNVVLHGLLSAPTAFRQVMSDPPNTVIGHFPFVWLPAFVVPMAYLLHILSLRKELSHSSSVSI
ncbi:MAG: hypothetical protein V4692_12695 [Bdellovibrionota bacterium]